MNRLLQDRLTLWATMSLILLAPVVAGAILTAAMVRPRLLGGSSIAQNGIRLGIVFALVRVSLVWATALGFQYSDFRQVVAYFLLGLNSFSEALMARGWRNEVWTWAVILSGLVAVSSMLLGLAFATVLQMIRRRRARA